MQNSYELFASSGETVALNSGVAESGVSVPSTDSVESTAFRFS